MTQPMTTDLLQSFLIDHSHIRGKFVRLGAAADAILRQHANPEPVSRLLAEMLVIVSMLSSNLKTEGVLTLQASGDGPVRFIVVDATHDGHLRGYAELNPESAYTLADDADLPALFGDGRLAITLDQGGGEGGRYQGVVELKGETFTQAVREYFTQSQQVDMTLSLAVAPPGAGSGRWTAAGILIERIPGEGGATPLHTTHDQEEGELEDSEERWNRAKILMESVREDELLDESLSSWALLERLFHEDGVWAYPPKPFIAQCRCSREKVAGILSTLPLDELNEMMVDGFLSVNCRFCNTDQTFSAQAVALLHQRTPGGNTVH